MSYTIVQANILRNILIANLAASMPFVQLSKPHGITGNSARDLTMHIKISYDQRSTWENGIYQNSRHAIFMVDFIDQKLMLLSGYGVGKFRRCSFKNDADCYARLRAFLEANGPVLLPLVIQL